MAGSTSPIMVSSSCRKFNLQVLFYQYRTMRLMQKNATGTALLKGSRNIISSLPRWISIAMIMCFFPPSMQGQDTTGHSAAFFFELAGSGGLGSFNYEKFFYSNKSTSYNWRAGVSVAPIDKNNGVGIVFPVMINAVTGKNANKLELGLGQGITITTKGNFFTLTTANIGYRRQPADKNWFYRINYTPLISYLVDFQWQHWGGISIGYSFNNKSK